MSEVSRARHRVVVMAVMAVMLAVLAVLLRRESEGTAPGADPVVHEFAIFDTYARFSLWTDQKRAEKALADCTRDLRLMHDTINTYDDTSELSHLNRTAADTPFVCSDLLWDILQAAREGYALSDGAFDISVGPLMQLWGFHRKRDTLPGDDEIRQALARVGLNRVEFNETNHTVRFSVPGMSLDVGGLAKGYALDRMMETLAEYDIAHALVDLGGNIGCTPEPPAGRRQFYVGIRDPFDISSMLAVMPVLGRSVATSGNYERRIVIQGRTIGHIIDPRTGRPASGPAGVTAITPNGLHSDVFSTAVFVRGEPMAKRLLKQVPETGFVLISGTPEAPVRTVIGQAEVESVK